MKTFLISLARAKERRSYIFEHVKKRNLNAHVIEAIDGSLLSDKDLEKACDLEQVNKLRWWLTNGAIGCALSHKIAYEKIIEENLKCCFIIEDDVVLPQNINSVLNDIENEITEDEIVLLYYTSFKPSKLSTVGKINISSGSLAYPMNIQEPITATAYVIGYKAAKGLLEKATPIRVTADCWHYYYEQGAFNSLRVLYPTNVKTKNYKSSIDYINNSSLKGKLSQAIDRFKIPLLHKFVKYLRQRRLNDMLNHFSLTDEPSPIYLQKHNLNH